MKKYRIDWGEAVVPGIGLVFGLSFFSQTGNAPKDAMQWPYLTAAAAFSLWVPIVVKYLRHRTPPSEKFQLRRVWENSRRVVFILIATVGYSISDRYLLTFGYRYLDIDYEKSSLDLDIETYGPTFGVVIDF